LENNVRSVITTIRFNSASLGNQKDATGKFLFQKNAANSKILFLASWHKANMKLAAEALGRHQTSAQKIFWDIEVDFDLAKLTEYYRFCSKNGNRTHWAIHEAIDKGQTVSIACLVPDTITTTDFETLMVLAGKHKGLSPWKPGQFGHFEVLAVHETKNTIQE
jgi:hypothetical protein